MLNRTGKEMRIKRDTFWGSTYEKDVIHIVEVTEVFKKKICILRYCYYIKPGADHYHTTNYCKTKQ